MYGCTIQSGIPMKKKTKQITEIRDISLRERERERERERDNAENYI